ncbi:MAG: HEPN domain-containing protein [Thermodesulfobacteriota bacterium]
MAIKGVLRLLGIEFPREHDVSDVILQIGWKEIGAPPWFAENIEKLAKIMREITPKRGPAMYGFEKEMRPAAEIFSVDDGTKALNEAKFVFESCQRFFEEWK